MLSAYNKKHSKVMHDENADEGVPLGPLGTSQEPGSSSNTVQDSLTKHFPDNPGLVQHYLELINAEFRPNTKIRRHDIPEIPASIVKINGQHFLFDKKLGKGYCGTVKRALHLETGESVVVKVTKPTQPIVSTVIHRIAENEKRILEYLNKHPLSWTRPINFQSSSLTSLNCMGNFTRALFGGKKNYTTQPLVEGLPLTALTDQVFTLDSAQGFIQSLFEALKELHDRQVFHGDIKYANIIFNAQTNKATFIDFGLAQLVDAEGQVMDNTLWMPHHLIIPKQLVGTFHQDCPEWYNGETLGLDSDIYALGALLRDFVQKIQINDGSSAIDEFKENIMNEIINPMLYRNRDRRPTIDLLIQKNSAIFHNKPTMV